MPEAGSYFYANDGTPAGVCARLREHLATIRDRQPWENRAIMEASLETLDSYTKLLRNRVLEAEAGTAENQTDLGRGCALGLRIAAALAGLPEGNDPTTRAVNGYTTPGEPDPIGDPDAGGEEAWHEFHDGPWAGQRVQVETSPDAYGHLVPYRPEVGVGEWVPAPARRDCYVRTGSYGETTVMTWSQT